MTLDDIIYNLDNTIAGKSSLKEALERHGPAFARLLEINISELKAIRADVIKVKTAAPPTMDEYLKALGTKLPPSVSGPEDQCIDGLGSVHRS